jgi:hypothetical protein
MIANDEVSQMIYHEVDTYVPTQGGRIQVKPPSILKRADYAYMMDFPLRSFRKLQDKVWISIPLFSCKALPALYELQPKKYCRARLACIRSGRAECAGLEDIPSNKARCKKNSSTKTHSKVARASDKSNAKA